MEYTFTLKYQLSEQDCDPDSLLERLGEAGCDDALVGIGQPGRLALEFAREAQNADEAIGTAIADVKIAVPSARLFEATPDLVGLTEVAELVGVSRQAMRKLMLAHSMTFPGPVHEGVSSIWHLADVLNWLKGRGSYSFDERVLEIAHVALGVNMAKELSRHPSVARAHQSLLTSEANVGSGSTYNHRPSCRTNRDFS